ncbi:MAG: thioredoxin-like domain-containing protein [Acidimicrobiia bacterium]|nr:thioredoxin-like domain-containing protein [Acidimicrobiia bacterium]
MRLLLAGLIVALLAAACTSGAVTDAPTTTEQPASPSTTSADEEPPRPTQPTQSFAGTVPAPEFPAGLDWLNSNGPIALEELQGKIVLLDFWTYGCINCLHIIPDLHQLEEEYSEELVVIGVHSAKFINEGETENIRQVVMRYGIDHPVVNDKDFQVWSAWGARAWPTIALIDPAGNVVGTHAGEGVYPLVQPVIEALIAEFDEQIDRTPFEFTPESATSANTILSYPGKVATDDSGATVFIADSGHHRVVAADATTGEINAVYGSGRAGFQNGAALEAQFDSPQGLAYDDATGLLYVADTNNHAVRTIDTATGEISTLAGTGALSWPPAAGLFEDVRLNSPWGLALRDEQLWVAMAGFHQIWVIDLSGNVAFPAVGSSIEGVANGALAAAELAQPSGVTFDGAGRLYFADSESSSIRWADVFSPDGATGLLSGSETNLFDFGDLDGVGSEAKLQHPLAVVWDEMSGDLIIADTYNSKLKRIDPDTGETTTYRGGGHGWRDGTEPLFYEPGGLAIAGGNLFVADTNNHVIRRVDLSTGDTSTLVLHGIEDFTPPPDTDAYQGTIVTLDPLETAAGSGVIRLSIELPEGHKVNEEAPSSLALSTANGNVILDEGNEQSLTGATLPVDLAATFAAGEDVITADVTLLYCRNDSEGLCIIEQVRFVQPVLVSEAGVDTIELPHTVVLPNI